MHNQDPEALTSENLNLSKYLDQMKDQRNAIG
jgi:hypothetical protein